MDTLPAHRCLTASLKVDYLRPTPLDPARPLRLIGRIREVKGRKVIVEIDVTVDGEVCVRGEVIAVQVPEAFVTEAIEKARGSTVGEQRGTWPCGSVRRGSGRFGPAIRGFLMGRLSRSATMRRPAPWR